MDTLASHSPFMSTPQSLYISTTVPQFVSIPQSLYVHTTVHLCPYLSPFMSIPPSLYVHTTFRLCPYHSTPQSRYVQATVPYVHTTIPLCPYQSPDMSRPQSLMSIPQYLYAHTTWTLGFSITTDIMSSTHVVVYGHCQVALIHQ